MDSNKGCESKTEVNTEKDGGKKKPGRPRKKIADEKQHSDGNILEFVKISDRRQQGVRVSSSTPKRITRFNGKTLSNGKEDAVSDKDEEDEILVDERGSCNDKTGERVIDDAQKELIDDDNEDGDVEIDDPSEEDLEATMISKESDTEAEKDNDIDKNKEMYDLNSVREEGRVADHIAQHKQASELLENMLLKERVRALENDIECIKIDNERIIAIEETLRKIRRSYEKDKEIWEEEKRIMQERLDLMSRTCSFQESEINVIATNGVNEKSVNSEGSNSGSDNRKSSKVKVNKSNKNSEAARQTIQKMHGIYSEGKSGGQEEIKGNNRVNGQMKNHIRNEDKNGSECNTDGDTTSAIESAENEFAAREDRHKCELPEKLPYEL